VSADEDVAGLAAQSLVNATPEIDYSQLMDLRIDFAFKLLFTKGDQRLLISLLNAIFANKKIPRMIKSLKIVNPYLEKESSDDKYSILDIRAELNDSTNIIIEMHMYGLHELKSKTIRSWARVYGEELVVGQKYAGQPPTIIIAFTNGNVKAIEKAKKISRVIRKNKIHRLCMIMDREDFTVFTNAMELHYIDMKAFAKAVNKVGSITIADTKEEMFAKWLLIITHDEIKDKKIIAKACEEAEEIQMAVSTLERQGKDKITRQAYQRRQDEVYYFIKNMSERDEFRQRAEVAEAEFKKEKQRAENEKQRAENEKQRAEKAEASIEKEQQRAEKEQQRAEKEQQRAELAEVENERLLKEIEQLRAMTR